MKILKYTALCNLLPLCTPFLVSGHECAPGLQQYQFPLLLKKWVYKLCLQLVQNVLKSEIFYLHQLLYPGQVSRALIIIQYFYYNVFFMCLGVFNTLVQHYQHLNLMTRLAVYEG